MRLRPGSIKRLKTLILALLILMAILGILSAEAFARTEARYEGRIGDTVFGNDIYTSRNIQTLFHQQSLNTSDLEHYSMSFPLFADGIVAGPTVAGSGAVVDGAALGPRASANVLPFGLVDLAFPSIQEDVTQTVSATQTGFFSATYNYRPEDIWGNVPVSTNYPSAARQAIEPAATLGWSQLYPEQYDTIAIDNKLKKARPAATAAPANQTTANQTAVNRTAPGQTTGNRTSSSQTRQALDIPINTGTAGATGAGQITAAGIKQPLAMDYFKPKNASSRPEDTPIIYPSFFDLAGKDNPVYPNPGYGTNSTNGAGSTGASLTGPVASGTARVTNATGNQTTSGRAAGNRTGNTTGSQTGIQSVKPTEPASSGLTYADFNFDATTEQINDMPIVYRMWRNAHRGGTMGKAYAGDTSAPDWIDPYERPNDVSMIDEHWYVLQSALNMVVPGTQIMPRFWSLGLV